VPLGFSFRFGIQAVMRIYFAFEMWEVKSSSIKGSSFRPDSVGQLRSLPKTGVEMSRNIDLLDPKRSGG
jgi:hypothetical protein